MKFFRQSFRTRKPELESGSNSRLRVWGKPSYACAGLLALAFLLLSACQQAEIKPLDIVTGDTCVRCKAPITEKHFAAEFVTRDGFVRKFDDVSCMIEHAAKVGRNNIAAYYVADFPSQKWIKADEAQFVKSEQISTPKNSGILAFKDPAQAKALAAQYQAQLVRFTDLNK